MIIRALAGIGPRLIGASRFLSRTAVKTAGKSSLKTAFLKYGGKVWKALDIGLTAYMIYDIFSTSDYEEGQDQMAWSMFIDTVLTDDVKLILAADINDAEAVAQGLGIAGIRLLDESDPAVAFVAMIYLSLSEYIISSDGRYIFSPDDVKEILSGEHLATLASSSDTNASTEIQEVFSNLDFDDMMPEQRRALDFLAYHVENLAEAIVATSGEDSDLSYLKPSHKTVEVVTGDTKVSGTVATDQSAFNRVGQTVITNVGD